MSVKLDLATVTAPAATFGIRLLGAIHDLQTPVAWACGKFQHTFNRSCASLTRRHRQRDMVYSLCAEIPQRAGKFQEIRRVAEANGRTLTGTAADYANQDSRLAVTCVRCSSCMAAPLRVKKLTVGHVCEVLGRERQGGG